MPHTKSQTDPSRGPLTHSGRTHVQTNKHFSLLIRIDRLRPNYQSAASKSVSRAELSFQLWLTRHDLYLRSARSSPKVVESGEQPVAPGFLSRGGPHWIRFSSLNLLQCSDRILYSVASSTRLSKRWFPFAPISLSFSADRFEEHLRWKCHLIDEFLVSLS